MLVISQQYKINAIVSRFHTDDPPCVKLNYQRGASSSRDQLDQDLPE
jgi:hypothetical protein